MRSIFAALTFAILATSANAAEFAYIGESKTRACRVDAPDDCLTLAKDVKVEFVESVDWFSYVKIPGKSGVYAVYSVLLDFCEQ